MKRGTLLWILLAAPLSAGEPPHSLAEAVAAKRDLWGEAAMRQPNGASYEFFEPLLPPPRYVNADFHYYPLLLSAPGAPVKARLASNGAGVNLRAGTRSWRDAAVPVVFRVGPDELRFGDLRDRVSLPKPAEGWLPIYEITYRHPYPVQSEGLVPIDQKVVQREAEVYRLEAFAATDPVLAGHGVVFVRFSLASGTRGVVSVNLDPPTESRFSKGIIKDSKDNTVCVLDGAWKWERQGGRAALKAGEYATLAVVTSPRPLPGFAFDAATFARQREIAAKSWKEIVGRSMQLETPEPRVNNAWKNLIVQNFMMLDGDRMNYSAGNQYEQIYSSEGNDAALAMMAWGHEKEAGAMFGPLLAFTRKGLEHHQAGNKLIGVVRYWKQTRDVEWLRRTRPAWQKEIDRLIDSRDPDNGLFPKERYCGDIATPVHSLSVQAKAWRGLHDIAPLLRALGDDAAADKARKSADEFQPRMMEAVRKSVRRETSPPFLPMALLANENVHDPITETRIGSYWNLINGYVIGSRIFEPGSPEETWLPRYLENYGGLCMGMIRGGGTAHAFWTGPDRVNPLYGTRYVEDVLRRDEPERALVCFYGMLAQGFTRDTFVAGEGCTLAPVDEGGRLFYCPPNSAGNAHFLTMLRGLLVQDFEDGDGVPTTLRLGYAMPRRWLEDGKRVAITDCPTAFGEVSVEWVSKLKEGLVTATVETPTRNLPAKLLLRVRVPDGWRATAADVAGRTLPVDDRGTVDLSGLKGKQEIRFRVSR